MSFWRQLTHGVRALALRGKRHSELDEELRQYFAEAEAEGCARGLSPKEARRRARLLLGDPAVAKDQVQSFGWENTLTSWTNDLRFAMRQLRKHPAFTLTAALTLALGIGANAAIFTVVQSVLLAPLPYANAGRLIALQTRWTDTGKTIQGVTGADMNDLRNQAHSIEALSQYHGGSLAVQLRNFSAYTTVTFADANFGRVFNLHPIAGRLFTLDEADRTVLVSEQFARDHFGSVPAALGQVLRVDNQPVEITGVLPATFDFPSKTQIWYDRPLHQPQWDARSSYNYRAVALLRDGSSMSSTRSELQALSDRLQKAYPKENRAKQLVFLPLQQAMTGSARPTLLLLWASVAVVLLIACVNVTHLQLVRSMERQREIALRKALGCSRLRVIQPVVLESLLVSLIGGTAGMLLAYPAVQVLVAMAPKELPRAASIYLNGWVLSFSFLLAIATAIVSSVLPALRAAKMDPAQNLKQDASRGMERHGARALRDGLVVAEVAATFVLAVGAGLLLHTMLNLMNRDMGYDTRQLLVVDADAPSHTDEDAQRAVQQFNQLFPQLASIPGVEHVAGIMGLPTGSYGSNGSYYTRGGLPYDPDHLPWANFSVASPGYFQTMGIPMRRGRDFHAQDTYQSPYVVVISESVAKQSFGDIDPIGKQIQCGLDSDKWMTVIGVVGDVRQGSPAEKPGPALYMPMAQHPFYANQIHVVLRTQVRPLTLMSTVEEKIIRINPAIALRFTTMDALLNNSVAAQRFRAALISTFAAVGLLLAMLGVYGTMAYSVTQRTVEIGVRMAFGAERKAVLRDVLEHAAKLACIGVVFGVGMSALLTRLVAGMLVGVQPIDPISIGTAAAVLVSTALAAAFAPGWRATRVNPMVALRAE